MLFQDAAIQLVSDVEIQFYDVGKEEETWKFLASTWATLDEQWLTSELQYVVRNFS